MAVQEYSRVLYNGSAAYELAPEYEEEVVSVQAPETATRQKKAAKATGVSTFAAVGFVVVAILMVFTLMSYVNYTTVAADTMNYQSRIDDLKDEQRKLTVAYETTFDINAVELYARNELGMDKPTGSQIMYVTPDASDTAVVFEQKEDRTVLASIADFITVITEYFG